MEGYLGESHFETKGTEYEKYTREDWAKEWISMYTGIDGVHHKDWLLDQVVRILTGSIVVISVAKWEDGTEELRMGLSTTTDEYDDFVRDYCIGEDGPKTYSYDEGIAP